MPTLSDKLPQRFDSWADFHDRLLSIRASLGPSFGRMDVIEYIDFPPMPVITRKPESIAATVRIDHFYYSIRDVAEYALKELKDSRKSQQFSIEDMRTLSMALSAATDATNDFPTAQMFIKLNERLTIRLRKELKRAFLRR